MSALLALGMRHCLPALSRPDQVWPGLIVGALGCAGRTWLSRVSDYRFVSSSFPYRMLEGTWPSLNLALPACGMAILVARHLGRPLRKCAPILATQAAAAVLGIGLGLAIIVAHTQWVPASRSIRWSSLTAPLALLAIVAAGVAAAILARRAARRRGAPPPAIAALLFGLAALLCADGFTWIPNANVQNSESYPIGAWVVTVACGLLYLACRRLRTVYYQHL